MFPHGSQSFAAGRRQWVKTDTSTFYVVRERWTLADTVGAIQVSHHMHRDATLYPRHRVLQLHSPIPYEPMSVFSCGGLVVSDALDDSNTNTDQQGVPRNKYHQRTLPSPLLLRASIALSPMPHKPSENGAEPVKVFIGRANLTS